jgi:hypothetical protein
MDGDGGGLRLDQAPVLQLTLHARPGPQEIRVAGELQSAVPTLTVAGCVVHPLSPRKQN